MLKNFKSPYGLATKDDLLLLMDIVLGDAVDESGRPPTMEERVIAEQLRLDWKRRQEARWERNPQAAAKVERELADMIAQERAKKAGPESQMLETD